MYDIIEVDDLDAGQDEDENEILKIRIAENEGLKIKIKELGADMYSLAQAEKDFALAEDRFWGPECFIKP